MKQLKPVLLALAVALQLGACRQTGAVEGDQPPADAPVLSVTAQAAKIETVRSQIELLGITAAQRHLTLKASTNGRLVGFGLQSGDRVVRGQVVAHIINRELEAAEAGLAAAKRIDPKDASQLDSAVKRYTGGPGIPVVAPATAIVSQRLVSSGQVVAYLDPMADLIDPNSMYVEAQLPIDVEALIRPGMEATVTSAIAPGIEYGARVVAIAPSFNANSETAAARLQFTGTRRIEIANAAVRVHLITRVVPEATVIDSKALFQNANTDSYYAFVAGEDGRAHRMPVKVGIREGDRVQIIEGLRPGAMVITSGGYALADRLRVKVIPDRKAQ